jgi:hypothetical protein
MCNGSCVIPDPVPGVTFYPFINTFLWKKLARRFIAFCRTTTTTITIIIIIITARLISLVIITFASHRLRLWGSCRIIIYLFVWRKMQVVTAIFTILLFFFCSFFFTRFLLLCVGRLDTRS